MDAAIINHIYSSYCTALFERMKDVLTQSSMLKLVRTKNVTVATLRWVWTYVSRVWSSEEGQND